MKLGNKSLRIKGQLGQGFFLIGVKIVYIAQVLLECLGGLCVRVCRTQCFKCVQKKTPYLFPSLLYIYTYISVPVTPRRTGTVVPTLRESIWFSQRVEVVARQLVSSPCFPLEHRMFSSLYILSLLSSPLSISSHPPHAKLQLSYTFGFLIRLYSLTLLILATIHSYPKQISHLLYSHFSNLIGETTMLPL